MDKHQLEAMVEPLARLLAAEAMAMVKDPYGENLPEDLWRLKVPAARDFLGLEVDTLPKDAILRA